jgi:hypothetical protein
MSIIQFDNRNLMIKHYSNLLNRPKIVEIGVFKGEFLEYIYNNCNSSQLDAVDIFQGVMGSGDVDGNNFSLCDLNKSFNDLVSNYKNYNFVKIYKSSSSDFFNTCEDNYYDIIYIDADHSYEGVKNDLKHSYKKIKNGGYIMGHDYEMNMKKAKTFYNFGTKKAVDEFCLFYKQNIIAKAQDGCVSFCIKINK